MKGAQAPASMQLLPVRVGLAQLVLAGGQTLPRVNKLPRPSEAAYQYLSLVLAAQAPVVTRQDVNGLRRVVANSATLALMRALVPSAQHSAFLLDCWEVQADLVADLYIDSPRAILDLMVDDMRALPPRDLLRTLRVDRGFALRRIKLDRLDDLTPRRGRKKS